MELTKTLEEKVELRTQDIVLRNKALETSHKILNSLPMGVLGVDIDGMVVFMNAAISEFIKSNNLELGIQIHKILDSQMLSIFDEALTNEKRIKAMQVIDNNIGVVCTPLTDKSGAILTFEKLDVTSKDYLSPTNENV